MFFEVGGGDDSVIAYGVVFRVANVVGVLEVLSPTGELTADGAEALARTLEEKIEAAGG
jgi:hypothetical protein